MPPYGVNKNKKIWKNPTAQYFNIMILTNMIKVAMCANNKILSLSTRVERSFAIVFHGNCLEETTQRPELDAGITRRPTAPSVHQHKDRSVHLGVYYRHLEELVVLDDLERGAIEPAGCETCRAGFGGLGRRAGRFSGTHIDTHFKKSNRILGASETKAE